MGGYRIESAACRLPRTAHLAFAPDRFGWFWQVSSTSLPVVAIPAHLHRPPTPIGQTQYCPWIQPKKKDPHEVRGTLRAQSSDPAAQRWNPEHYLGTLVFSYIRALFGVSPLDARFFPVFPRSCMAIHVDQPECAPQPAGLREQPKIKTDRFRGCSGWLARSSNPQTVECNLRQHHH